MTAFIGRREFIALLGSAASWPLPARAQQEPSPIRPLIGVLSQLSAAAASRNMAAFRSGLRDHGYVEGGNATLKLRFGDGAPERMAALAAELIALKPDVLFAAGKASALAVQGATRTIPIVMTTPEDPIASGLANTIARPGGNVTGTWLLGDDALVGKRLELLLLAVPALSRVGIVANPDDPSDGLTVARLPAAAGALGVGIDLFEVRDVNSLDAVSAQVMRAGVQALFVGPGPTLVSGRAEITRMVARLRLAGHVRLQGVRGRRRSDVLRTQPSRHTSAIGQTGGQDSERRTSGRSADRAADSLRTDRKSQDRKSARTGDPGLVPAARRRGDRVIRREFITLLGGAAARGRSRRARSSRPCR